MGDGASNSRKPKIWAVTFRKGVKISLYDYKLWDVISFLCPPGAAPPAATVVIVVCIAALVVIVVIGVYRIHATHQEETRDEEDEAKEPEEDWDSSALSITVNPMEVCVLLWIR